MSLANTTTQRERDRFVENSEGDTATRVVVDQAQVNKKWACNTVDDYTTTDVIYTCKEDNDGNYLIIKIDQTGNFIILSYATILNNPTITTYASAYANRTILTYGTYSEAL